MQLLQHQVKRKEIWMVEMKEEEVEDVDEAVEDSEVVEVSVDAVDSVDLDSGEDLEVVEEDSGVIVVDIAEVAELEVEEEDSVVEEVVSVEAMMEERAVLKLNNLPPPSLSFKKFTSFVTLATASAEVFLFIFQQQFLAGFSAL